MLSILIPTYNFDVFPLVDELHSQCEAAKANCEIIVFDDGSGGFLSENHKINSLPNCRFESLLSNVGRSKIRNLLASEAKSDNFLFLDADVMPARKDFIERYISEIDGSEKIVSGGLKYQQAKPSFEFLLHWTYGREREAIPVNERQKKPYQSILASNFMISRTLFKKSTFEESLPDLHCEDMLFSYRLMNINAVSVHIDNPVFHLGIDDFEVTLNKQHQSLQGLKMMLDKKLIEPDYTKLLSVYSKIRGLSLDGTVAAIWKMIRKSLLKNLSGTNPSMFLFDIYRIGYLCSITNKA